MEKRKHSLFRNSGAVVSTAIATLLVFACQSSPKAESQELENVLEAPTPKTVEDATFDITVSAAKAVDGSLLRISLKAKSKREFSAMKAVFEGVIFPVLPFEQSAENDQYDAYVVIPFNSKPRQSVVEIKWSETDGGLRKEKQTSVPVEIIDGNYRSEKLTVDGKKIDPPKKVLKRILSEQREIGALYRKVGKQKLWSGPFELPIESEITSPFGNKRVYNGKMNGFHQGLDLRARTPVPIRAPEGARVALAKDLYFTGGTVILDHGHGLFTIYAHMSKIDVKKGDRLEKGKVLGLSGATGRISGPHLHWGAVLMRQKFNPQDLVRVLR